MKHFLLLLFLLPATAWAFQQPAGAGNSGAQKVTVVCKLFNIPQGFDSIALYEPMGLANRLIMKGGRRPVDSAFVLTVPAGKNKVYGIGPNETLVARVILGEEPEVTLYANVQVMQKGRTVNSPVNKAAELLIKRLEQFKTAGENARLAYIPSNGQARKEAEARLVKLSAEKTAYLDSLKAVNPLFHHIASLYLIPDFYGQKGFANELEFASTQYFANANLVKDRAYDEIPDVFNAFERYTQLLMQLGATPDQTKAMTEAMLAKLPEGSKTHRMALSGVYSALKIANSQYFPEIGNRYIKTYKAKDYGEVSRLDFEIKRASTFTPGYEAPDLVGMTPDSSMYALSKLRGKVVLIDFWASWCGPCRKENPNVKANYEKYKDRGFDVFGVSLDREAGAWRQAIQQDGLVWHHISDLKGWQSQYADLYSVTSIPQTVLIDKEGKIIARNVRGEQLGQKLKELLGE